MKIKKSQKNSSLFRKNQILTSILLALKIMKVKMQKVTRVLKPRRILAQKPSKCMLNENKMMINHHPKPI